MANFVLQDQKIFLAHYNLTPNINAVALSQGRDNLEDTTFGSNTRSGMPGLMSATFSVSGFWDSTAIDLPLSSQLGLQNKPVSILNSTSAGGHCYFLNAMTAEYSPFQNRVGEIIGFNASGVATRGTSAPANLIRGQVAYWAENFTTSANGTSVNLGAVSTSQRLYAAVHVLSVPSTQHSVLPIIESAASSAASSSQWTTVISFSTFTAAGSSFVSCTGNITDTWLRLRHTTVSSSQSTGISVTAVFGIL